MKKTFYLFVIVFLAGSCNIKTSDSKPATQEFIDSVLSEANEVPEKIGWQYYEESDPMTDKVIYFASIEANELLYFDFPYSGGTSSRIVLRDKDDNLDIMYNISEGQFYSSYNEGKYIKARFDSIPSRNYNYSESSSADSDVIFINNKSLFLQNLKKSKKLTLQAQFYQEGWKTVTFNVDSLKWNH